MPRTGFRLLVHSAALIVLAPGPLRAEPPRVNLEAEVAAGLDTNPLELSGEVLPREAIPSGSFMQISAGGRLAGQWTDRAGWFASAEGHGRFHPSSFDEADASHGRMEGGLGLVLWSRGERRLSAALRGSFGMERSTFVDPATGSIYFAGDPNAPHAIPDRFDRDATSVNVDLRFRASKRLLFLLDSSLVRDDYAEDGDRTAPVDSLDGRSIVARPGVRWNITESIRLDVSTEWGSVAYDELPSLDENATAVPDEPRRYRSTQLRAALRVEPSARWSFSVGGAAGRRDDLHAGYYDSLGESAYGTASWSPREGLRMSLQMSRSHVDYEHATLDGTADGELRGGDVVTTSAAIEKDLFTHLTVRAQGARVASSNQDPLYTYDRAWALVGLRYVH